VQLQVIDLLAGLVEQRELEQSTVLQRLAAGTAPLPATVTTRSILTALRHLQHSEAADIAAVSGRAEESRADTVHPAQHLLDSGEAGQAGVQQLDIPASDLCDGCARTHSVSPHSAATFGLLHQVGTFFTLITYALLYVAAVTHHSLYRYTAHVPLCIW
jgi:hypothetical protein